MLLLNTPAFAQSGAKQNIIRVCVLKDAPSIRLTLDSAYRIYSRDNRLVKEGKSLYKAKVAATQEGLMLGGAPIKLDAIRLRPSKDGRIYIDKWRFRGEVDIFKTPDMKLVAVNLLDVEDYLYGVLYHEVSHYWPYEVLKAQAIAARTYALYQKQIMKGKDYDVTADIYSQVYGGRANEKYRTNRAVNLTKGRVLYFKGEIFPAYYHATCGGFTEDASNLWKINLSSLKGVECKFCKRSKHFNWKRKIKLNDMENALRKKGYNISSITSIKIESRNTSNRINNLVIAHGAGESIISGKDFRTALGPNLLKSNNYNVALEGRTAVFKGIGWGHGVGMCQWGAYFMAKKGYKADSILKHYYPGSEIK
ncbi:MAG: SpoIID/LytB domain-containing protein [Candidatus Omnitrophica bacterium]|nr:SpoIID/LytB domain-containing protein [Candidatus Omnitrophota bacterium]